MRQGFTLIELLVVIAIIGVLSSVVLVSLDQARARARDAQRISDLKQIQTALEMYYGDHGYYPRIQHALGYYPNTETVAGCGHVDRWCSLEERLSPYIPELPRDPLFNSTYHYSYTANAGNDWQTYGLYVALEGNDEIAKNDGGYYPSAGSERVRYEVGPQVQYCTNKYSGAEANWFGGKDPHNWAWVCAGGN